MDNWFEFLIPIIIVLLYLFSRGRGGDEMEGPPPSESETSEEARRIQEEIRRKIVARQQGKSGDASSAQSETATVETPREAAPPATEFFDTGFPTEFERYGEAQPDEPEWVEPPAAAPAGRDFQGELKAQLRRVKEARDARRAAVREAANPDEIGGGGAFEHRAGEVYRRYGTYSLNAVLDELHSRDGLQKAFVLKEVLGRPVGVRHRRDSYAEFAWDDE